jgi:hypothetical protein
VSRRLSQDEILEAQEQVMATIEEQLAAKALQQHQEANRPKRQLVQSDWSKSPDRWLGVKSGPAGLKKI